MNSLFLSIDEFSFTYFLNKVVSKGHRTWLIWKQFCFPLIAVASVHLCLNTKMLLYLSRLYCVILLKGMTLLMNWQKRKGCWLDAVWLFCNLCAWTPGVYASPCHLIGQLSLLCGRLQTHTLLHYLFCCGGRLCSFLTTDHLRELLEVWAMTIIPSRSHSVSPPPVFISLTHSCTVERSKGSNTYHLILQEK